MLAVLVSLILSFHTMTAEAATPRNLTVPSLIRQPLFYNQRIRELVFNETLKWLRPDQKYLALEITRSIVNSAKKYGHDPLLILSMIIQESSVRPQVRGSAGEIGLMQLKLSTAKWLARRLRMRPPKESELFKPELNIEFGAAYLAYLREATGSNRFIQAYNSGPAAVRKLVTHEYTSRISRHYQQLLAALEVTGDSSFANLESNVESQLPDNLSGYEDPPFPSFTERAGKGSRIP